MKGARPPSALSPLSRMPRASATPPPIRAAVRMAFPISAGDAGL